MPRWVAEAPGNTAIHGYHLSRLYSPWLDLPPMIEASRATTPAALQEFYNSDLGEVFSPEGGGLTPDALDRCRDDYSFTDYAGQPCVMGVDVGLRLHVVVRELTLESRHDEFGRFVGRSARAPRLWHTAELRDFEELDALMARFHVEQCVIDALPETRGARSLRGAPPRAGQAGLLHSP